MAPMGGKNAAAVLKAAAKAIAASLADGSELAEGGPAELLKELLLAESADENDAAAMRCMLLRTDIVVAVREALAARPETTPAAGSGFRAPPAVRVEVRGTGGRSIPSGAFSVGTDPLCDVQVFGDPSVLPLQCVVVPVPGGLVVADAWSPPGPRMAWWRPSPWQARVDDAGCARRRAVLVPHGVRTVFRIGDRTTFALGSPATPYSKAAEAEIEEAALATAEAAAKVPELGKPFPAAASATADRRLSNASVASTAFEEFLPSGGSSSGSWMAPRRSRSCRREALLAVQRSRRGSEVRVASR